MKLIKKLLVLMACASFSVSLYANEKIPLSIDEKDLKKSIQQEIQSYKDIVSRYPNSVDAHYNLAVTYLNSSILNNPSPSASPIPSSTKGFKE